MTRHYKSALGKSDRTLIEETELDLTYAKLNLKDWERDIIDCFTTEKSLLTKEDVLVWIQFIGREDLFGKTDISGMAKSSQDAFKKDLKVLLRAAESHKRIKCAPFGGL